MVFRACTSETDAREEGNGEREVLRRADALHLKLKRRGEEWESWGVARARAVAICTAIGEGEQLKGGDGSDGWVPHGGEREEGRRGLSAGPWPKKRKGEARGIWAEQAERRREGGRVLPFSFFSNKFFNTFSN